MDLVRYLPGSSSLHSPGPSRAAATAFANRFDREGPNSTVSRRSTSDHPNQPRPGRRPGYCGSAL